MAYTSYTDTGIHQSRTSGDTDAVPGREGAMVSTRRRSQWYIPITRRYCTTDIPDGGYSDTGENKHRYHGIDRKSQGNRGMPNTR